MYVQIQLKDLVKSIDLVNSENVDKYCLDGEEGEDPETWIMIKVRDDFVFQIKGE